MNFIPQSPHLFAPLLSLRHQSHPPVQATRKSPSMQPGTGAGSVGLWVFETVTQTLQLCPVAQQLCSLPAQSVYTLPAVFNSVAFHDRKAVLAAFHNACHGTGCIDVAFQLTAKDNAIRRWIKVSGRMHHQLNEARDTFMGTITDITVERQEQAWQNDRLALLGHELKAPLTTMRLYMQLVASMAREARRDDYAQLLSKADEQVTAMSHLMNDLLAAPVPAGMPLLYESFDINELIREVVCQFELTAPGYIFLLKMGACQTIKADRYKIRQVLINLIGNAVKYSPPGRVITIKCVKSSNGIKVSVADQGAGIKPAYQQQLFERYYRTPDAGASGHGLGLYLVKKIIDQHGGRIGVQSQEAKGATFWLTLPA